MRHSRTFSPAHKARLGNATPAWDNNFQLLRLVTALVVAATHSLWVVYGVNPPDTATMGFLIQASHCGICIFFGLSGYLITASLMNRPNLFRYAVSRMLRLCPLLFVTAVVMAFVVGPFVSELSFSDYYNDMRLWAYVPASTLAHPDMTLPGVFVNAPAESEVNISLWTLRYEIIAYLVMAVASAIGLLTSRNLWLYILIALASYVILTHLTELRAEVAFINHGLRFGLAFLVGVVLYRYQSIVPLSLLGVVLLIALAGLTNDTAFMEAFRILALVYTAVWFGVVPLGRIRLFNRLGDYSYGIFVFHWPIAQVVLHYNPTMSYLELVGHVLPMSLLLAVVSWHGLEAPLLRSKASIASGLLTAGGFLRALWRDAVEVMTVYPEDEAQPRGRAGSLRPAAGDACDGAAQVPAVVPATVPVPIAAPKRQAVSPPSNIDGHVPVGSRRLIAVHPAVRPLQGRRPQRPA